MKRDMNTDVLISLLTNWRFYLLVLFYVVASILAFGETDSAKHKIVAVIAAVAIIYFSRAVYRYWLSEGSIEDVDKLFKEE